MIRHRNYYDMVAVIDGVDDFVMNRDTMLSTCRSRTTSGAACISPGRTSGTRSRSSAIR
jgi:hypothetical protein